MVDAGDLKELRVLWRELVRAGLSARTPGVRRGPTGLSWVQPVPSGAQRLEIWLKCQSLSSGFEASPPADDGCVHSRTQSSSPGCPAEQVRPFRTGGCRSEHLSRMDPSHVSDQRRG